MSAVEIRELDAPADLDELARVFDDVWHPDPSNRPVATDMLRALAHSGNYVVGAYVDGRLAGGSVGFFGAPVGEVLHSHMTGVNRLGSGHQLGYAIKLHQRAWARERGLSTITWTFDPLVARNAYFNIVKLGAHPTQYHRDFYGDIGDEINGGDESDRVVMSWPIGDDDPPAPPGAPADALPLIDTDDHGHPVVGEVSPLETDSLLIPIPTDIETMRRQDPRGAAHWRAALRTVLEPLLSTERPIGFLRSGCYVLGPATAATQKGESA